MAAPLDRRSVFYDDALVQYDDGKNVLTITGADGIRFDVENAGGYLHVTTNGSPSSGLGIELHDTSANGVKLFEEGDGGLTIRSEGGGIQIQETTGGIIITDTGGGINIVETNGGINITTNGSSITISAGGAGAGTLALAAKTDVQAQLLSAGSKFTVLNSSSTPIMVVDGATGLTTGTFDGGSP